jgi:hypothetical protein
MRAACFFAIFTVLSQHARAAVIYTFTESTEAVTLSYTGSINTAALSLQGGLSADDRFIDILGVGAQPLQMVFEFQNFQHGAEIPPPPYTGVSTRYSADDITFNLNLTFTARRYYPTSATGDTFGFYVFQRSGQYFTWLNVPFLYASGDPIAGSMTFAGQSFASMGLTPGESLKLFLPGNESVSVIVVPEPVLLPAIAAAGSMILRRRRGDSGVLPC